MGLFLVVYVCLGLILLILVCCLCMGMFWSLISWLLLFLGRLWGFSGLWILVFAVYSGFVLFVYKFVLYCFAYVVL